MTTPPATAAREPDARIELLVDEFGQGLDEAREVFFGRVQEGIVRPLRLGLEEALAAHDRALDRLRAASEEEGEEPPTAWRSIETYRQDTLEGVLAPLAATVASVQLLDPVDREIERLVKAWLEVVDSLPPEVRRTEPVDLYRPQEGESFLRRSRKAWARLVRKVRRQADPEQIIAARALGDFHVRERLVGRELSVLRRAAADLARPIAELERSLTAWTMTVMENEVMSEGPLEAAPEAARHFVVGAAGEGSVEERDSTFIGVTLAAGQQLRESLSRALEASDLSAVREDALERALVTWRDFEEDVRVSDTFMLPGSRLSHEMGGLDIVAQRAKPSPWLPWHRQAADRLALIVSIHRFGTEISELLSAYHSAVWEAGVSDLIARSGEVSEQLRSHSAELEDEYADLKTEKIPAFRHELQRIRVAVRSADETHRGALARLDAEDRVARSGNQPPEDVLSAIGRLPEKVEVHVLPDGPDAPPDPGARTRALLLREIALQSYDALRLEGLRTAVAPVAAALATARSGADALSTVAEFNLDSADDELDAEGHADLTEAFRGALTLAVDGLARSAGVLDTAVNSIGPAFLTFGAEARDALHAPWSQMFERALAAGAVQEQLLDLRSRLRQRSRDLAADATASLARLGVVAERYWRLTRARAHSLVRLGRSAVGSASISEGEMEASLQSVADFERMLSSLPLVYRRLFTFQPVEDPAFLVGRGDDLDWIASRVSGWRPDTAAPLVVTAFQGAGLTSFIQCLPSTVLTDDVVTHVVFRRRLNSEGAVVELLADELAIEAGPLPDFASLAQALTATGPVDRPRIVMVEKLEHLMIRTQGGSDLVERLLSFMSQTSGEVLWIGTMVQSAWQFMEKTELRAARLCVRRALAPLTREQAEQAIIERHDRSGLPLHFEDPADPNPLLKRRLRRARDGMDRESVLRQDFFDRLVRATDANLMLSFFYWLESARFSEDGGLRVRSFRPISFAYLSNLDLQQTFTLKAFLQHSTLTLAEHDRIFSCARKESAQVFQSLGHLLLISPVPPAKSAPEESPEAEVRYQVRPLMVQPVMQRLRTANVLH